MNGLRTLLLEAERAELEKQQRSHFYLSRDTDVSRHHGGQIDGPTITPVLHSTIVLSGLLIGPLLCLETRFFESMRH